MVVIERSASVQPRSRELLASELGRDGEGVLVASPAPSTTPVAFLSFRIVHDEAHVVNVATQPAHRRAGHATRLLTQLHAVAAERGLRYLRLEVRRSNIAAIDLYQRLGFQTIGVRPMYYGDNDEDAFIMLRRVELR